MERTSHQLIAVSVIAVGFVTLLAGACSGAGEVPDPEPLPEDANFEAVWYSDQFKHMYLQQDGDQVEGVYAYRDGGRLEGEVDGNLLIFEWEEPGDKQSARRTMKGRGYLQLTVEDDQPRLDGEWGYKEEVTGGGPWEAEFIREFDADSDPLTIDEIDEKGD
ncbi:MAG: hypothetical protein ACOCV2_13755 [Persicimonas sp.]